LTLGRWSGSFGELGWVSQISRTSFGELFADKELKAWNVRPKRSNKKWRPTAEFVEGFLIFLYGSTNIFLEHLGKDEPGFSPQDLEHMSITVLFIGGGVVSRSHSNELFLDFAKWRLTLDVF
jgi:hypothetical protein